jgi:hypothetical protein
MSTRTIREYQRRTLEQLALEFEEDGYDTISGVSYTCNVVAYHLGAAAELSYARTFGFGTGALFGTEQYLWKRSDKEKQNLRVLLLCFAAAMAATGDL